MAIETAAATQSDAPGHGKAVMDAYFEALLDRADFARHFTPDVTFSLEGNGMAATGATEVEQTIRFLHEVAFDAQPVLRSLIVEGERAAAELEFVGTHTGEFAGIAATGRRVSVPYSVVYDLRDGKIAALRAYMALSTLLAQLGAPAAGAAPAN